MDKLPGGVGAGTGAAACPARVAGGVSGAGTGTARAPAYAPRAPRSRGLVPAALGNSPRVVMEILDHSGIAITMNTYAHVLPTLLGSAVAGMDDVLG